MTETIEQVAESVWVGIPGYAEGAMAAVAEDGAMLVLDSTSYTVFAERFVAEVAKAAGVPGPTLLYISHRHFDHFGGASVIHAPVIGHRLTRAAIARFDQDWIDRNVAEWTKLGMVVPALVRDPRPILPTILFEDRLVLHIGESVVELLHVGGHCADQTVAYLPNQRVLFASDNIIHGKEPYVGDGDLVTWIEALRLLGERPLEVVIPGHGPVGGPELIGAQIAVLEGLLATALRSHV